MATSSNRPAPVRLSDVERRRLVKDVSNEVGARVLEGVLGFLDLDQRIRSLEADQAPRPRKTRKGAAVLQLVKTDPEEGTPDHAAREVDRPTRRVTCARSTGRRSNRRGGASR